MSKSKMEGSEKYLVKKATTHMTALQITMHFKAYCPLDPLRREEVVPGISLPPAFSPVPHLTITDPAIFISTALTRLHSNTPILSSIAARNLLAFITHTQGL